MTRSALHSHTCRTRSLTLAQRQKACGVRALMRNVANENPRVHHPRWSQATERRIGQDGLFAKKRKTLMLYGYEARVGQLVAGMDLKKVC